jgi:hypothetical protein
MVRVFMTTARGRAEIAYALSAALARQPQPSAWADNRARHAAAP